jgi:putative ABC transport system substrate-binding protein
MTDISQTAFLLFRSDNRKSAIKYPKWMGVLAVALTLAFDGGVAKAQEPARIPRIAFLSAVSSASIPRNRIEAFRQGLRELGYIEGKTITIEDRFADGK